MRVLRILLCNYRGVEDCEVRFAPQGVTVVEGPNESGKTSLAEALRVVLNEKENSTKKNVRDLKRTDRDVPTEVEVDIETGPYRFTLRKAFNKRSRAELQIHAPRPETLTGGEVHARVREILDETVDIRLLDALWVQQGVKVEQTSLAGCTSLGEALDRAAGTVPAGDLEETLFERATLDYRRYWTPTGGQGRELVGSSRRVLELQQQVEAAADDGRRLDTYIEASERLQREVAALALDQERTTVQAHSARARLMEVEQAEAAIAGVEARVTTTAVQRDAAVKALEARQTAIADLQQAEHELAQSTADLHVFDERLAPLREQSDDAAARRDEAHASLIGARDLLDRRKGDRQHADDLVHLQMLHERIARVDQLTADVAAAQAIVDRVQMTDAAITSLRKQGTGIAPS
jgi:DNA repair exonuclease SbcCD ATPase subunit